MIVRVSLLLALALAGCGPDPSSPDASAPTDRTGGPEALVDTSMVRDVSPESTLDLVAGGLVQASPSVAIQTLDLWVSRLDTVSADGVPALRDDLVQLRDLLQSSPLDGPAIGRTLQSLGDQTGALAEPGTPLSALGRSLRTQGDRLVPDSTRVGAPADTDG